MADTMATVVGRMVQGDAFEPQTKDQQGNPLVVKSGPNKGEPMKRWFIGVAFAKNDPGWPAIHRSIMEPAAAAWPRFFPAGWQGACTHPKFASKIIDGDGYDTNGRLHSEKEGFAGHWVVRFASGYAPNIYEAGKYDRMQAITDPRMLKRGYYVRVGYSVESNNNEQNPGMFVNLQMLEIIRPGPEITSGPDAASVFGGAPQGGTPAPAPMPAGSTQRLVATGAHTVEQLRAAGWTDDAMVANGYARWEAVTPPAPPSSVTPPPAPPVPTPGALPTPAGAAPSPSAMPSPSNPPAPPYGGYMQPPKQLTAAANGHTYEALIAAGWTDAMLIEKGLMLP